MMGKPDAADTSVPDKVQSALAKIESHPASTAGEASLSAEVKALAVELRQSMEELRSIGAARIASEDIPSATDELDAIVEVTASATGSILDACEQVEDAAGRLTGDALAEALTEATTCIYQACNFQDLTGQRVTKVISTLRTIDRRVTAICAVFGLDADEASISEPTPSELDPDDESHLLNGPGLPDQAMSQDDIDRILAGLD